MSESFDWPETPESTEGAPSSEPDFHEILDRMELRCRDLAYHIQADVNRSLTELRRNLASKGRTGPPTLQGICEDIERYREACQRALEIQRSIKDDFSLLARNWRDGDEGISNSDGI